MGKRKRKNGKAMYSHLSGIKTSPQTYFSLTQQHIPTMTAARIDLLENEIKAKDKLIEHFQSETKEMERECKDYEEKVKNLNDKLTSAASEKYSILDKNQRYEKQATDLKEDIRMLKKSAWIGIDNYAKMKIESLEKQIEEGARELKNELKDFNNAMKARNEKVHRLKEVIEAKDKTIQSLEAKVKESMVGKNKIILKQSKDLISYEGIIKEQGIELKNKDRIINRLRREKEDNHDIQLTEVIREREFIEVHTVDDNHDCG